MGKPDSNIIELLQTISAFNTDSDFDNKESKQQLSDLFNKLIMSDEPKAKDFFSRFMDSVSTIIDDMGVMSDEEGTEDLGPKEEPVEEEPVSAEDEELGDELGIGDEEEPVEEEPITDSYSYSDVLVSQANRFIYE